MIGPFFIIDIKVLGVTSLPWEAIQLCLETLNKRFIFGEVFFLPPLGKLMAILVKYFSYC